MSDLDGLIFNFDEVEGVLPSDTPGFKPFEQVDFGCYQLVADKFVSLKKGASIQIAGHERKGYEEGGKTRALFMVVTRYNANGEPYEKLEDFNTTTAKYDASFIAELQNVAMDERQQESLKKNGYAYLSVLSNMFIPSMKKMSKRAEFSHGKPLYAMVKRCVYESNPNMGDDGQQKVNDAGKKMWYNHSYPYEFVKYFDNADQLRAAANQYYEDLRNQRENGNGSGVMFPATWKNSLDAMKDYAQKVWKETNSRDEVQKKLNLTPDMLDEKENPVDVEAILNALTDTAF